MAEWLQSIPCLYNKKLEAYRKADMKKRLWVDKVAKFTNVDVDYLLVWYNSIRTHFGKLSKIPFGSGAQDLTEQLSKLACLKNHISRQRGTQLGGVSLKNQLDFTNLLLFHIHMYYCITFIFSNPCFVLLYLQLDAKLTTAARPRASLGQESDDSTADVIKVLASSTMSSSPRPMSCPPELTRPPSVLKKTKSSTVQTGVALRERADDSRNSRVQFGL